MPAYFLRHPELAVVGHGERVTFVLPGRASFSIFPCDPARISLAVKALRTPRDSAELEAFFDLKDLLRLAGNGFLLSADDPSKLRAEPVKAPKRCKRLVLGITGAIGAVNTVPLVLHLLHRFAEHIDVVLTQSACKLVRPEVFSYLGVETWTDAFEPRGEVNVPHIHLARADVIAIAPASAHMLHELATGACASLLSLVVAATRAPVVLAPSMNVAMWENPAIAENVATLRRRGFHIVEPSEGFEVSDKADTTLEYGSTSLDPAVWLALLESVLG